MSAADRGTSHSPQGWQGHPANGGVDPLVALLLQRLDDQEERTSAERQAHTTAMTSAFDRLGGRFEARIAEQTAAMVEAQRSQTTAMMTAVKIASGVIVVALLLLGAIGGAVVTFDGAGMAATTNGSEAP